MPEPLTLQEVHHVAKLARLAVSDEQAERYRRELTTILDHIAKLRELDVRDVPPMAHPTEIVNALAEDEPGESMAIEQVLANAPAREGAYLVVPKVLAEEDA